MESYVVLFDPGKSSVRYYMFIYVRTALQLNLSALFIKD